MEQINRLENNSNKNNYASECLSPFAFLVKMDRRGSNDLCIPENVVSGYLRVKIN